MTTSNTVTKNEVRDPYSIQTDSGEIVNAGTANPNKTIQIHGHRIKVREIPITAARLSCGHSVRGIAFAEGNLVYCDRHGEKTLFPATVVEVI